MTDFNSFKPRKLTALTENESVTSFMSWKQTMEFQLASCNAFSPFLDAEWGTKSVPNIDMDINMIQDQVVRLLLKRSLFSTI